MENPLLKLIFLCKNTAKTITISPCIALVVASNVGGIPMQIENGRNGFLLEPKDTEGFADRIVHLLKNPKEGEKLGHQGKETVRENFLITRLLSDYLYMLNSLIGK